MKKTNKLFKVCLVLVLVFTMMAMPVYAAEEVVEIEIGEMTSGNTAMPLWDTASSATAGLSISIDGTAKCTVNVTPIAGKGVDRISANVRLFKSNGSSVKTWNESMVKDGSDYCFSESYEVSTKSYYYVSATLYCYKNNVLVETITCKSKAVAY